MIITNPAQMPLIVAGPILRRVEKSRVVVWVALTSAESVTLQISEAGSTSTLSSNRGTSVQIGASLFLVLVDFDLAAQNVTLDETKVYFYDLQFEGSRSGTLKSDGILTPPGQTFSPTLLSYTGLGTAFPNQAGLPSFVLPQSNLSNLCLSQGSCRKGHAQSIDALVTLDAEIEANASTPSTRPQQLFSTGDQIYGDDVGDATLDLIQALIPTLIAEGHFTADPSVVPPLVGGRDDFMHTTCSFTTDKGVAKSHLLTFGEYAVMYLLMWSPALWPAASDLATFSRIYPGKPEKLLGIFRTSDKRRFDNETEALTAFIATLPVARRALANIANYMLLDDHDVTDDFYMDRAWLTGDDGTHGVINSAPGKTVVRNGLLTYALFQAWGNAPASMTALLDPVGKWASGGLQANDTTNLSMIESLLGLPTSLGLNDLEFQRPANALNWNYILTFDNYQVIALDTRTHRAYPTAGVVGRTQSIPLLPAALVSNASLGIQIPSQTPNWVSPDGGVTFVITPGPLANVSLFEDEQLKAAGDASVFKDDVELLHFDAQAYDTLIARLAARDPAGSRIISLSGDVHMSYAASIQYWSPQPNPLDLGGNDGSPGSTGPTKAIVVQLVSSAMKNQNSPQFPQYATGTTEMHYLGFVGSDRDVTRLGWLAQTGGGSLDVGTGAAITSEMDDPNQTTQPGTWSVPVDPRSMYQAAVTELAKEGETFGSVTPSAASDWRMHRLLIAGSTDGQKDAGTVSPINEPGGSVLLTFLTLLGSWFGYVGGSLGGHAIVGVNNVAIVTLDWTQKTVTQRLLWFGRRLGKLYEQAEESTLTDLLNEKTQTTATVSLALADPPDPFGAITLPTS